MARILIADDEASIRDAVSFYIRKEGHDVIAVADGREALSKYADDHFDLVILDIMMPNYGGYEVCSAIRDKDPGIPVIFLSVKDSLIDKNLGFKLGADDYITKPFEPTELVLRVNSCLRRGRISSPWAADEREDAKSSTIILGDLRIETSTRCVFVSNKRIDLTAKEYEVLLLLSRNPDTVFSRQQILDAVWGVDYFGSAGIVAVFIRKLRQKIEKDASHPTHILTEWGVGYRIV